jgi:D-serine deaminase-like pyridoxal phosphate-dependent protein
MPTTEIRITLPADETLVAQVEQELVRYAEVMRPPPQVLSIDSIELIAQFVEIAADSATAIKTLLEIREMLTRRGKADQARIATPSGEERSFAEADEAFLKELLGIAER